MRTVSFSNQRVRNAMNNQFTCCYTNTAGDPTAGASFSHAPADAPGPCGRGAGRQNVQTIFMTPRGEIFHVSTGYLDAGDLLEEADFARTLYAELRRTKADEGRLVESAHHRRLRQLGFQDREIASRDSMLGDMLLSGPNPQDFGIQLPSVTKLAGVSFGGRDGDPFSDVARRRRLQDHKFVMARPMMSYEQFQQDPRSLVGHHNSFFGSHSAMSGLSGKVNQRIHQRGGGGF